MSHVQADRLVLAALGEAPLDEPERSHVDTCASCGRELESLGAVAEVARRTRGLDELPAPPQRVWDAIVEELSPGGAEIAVLPSAPRAPRTQRGRRPRWLAPAAAAVAAAAAAVLGTVLVVRQPEPALPSCTGQRVELGALPGTPSQVHGSVCLADAGERSLRVEAVGMPTPNDAVYTVWLIDPSSLSDPDGIRLQALGNMGELPDADFPVPGTIDLSTYSVVDISREPNDGDAAHSGDSLLRGQLK